MAGVEAFQAVAKGGTSILGAILGLFGGNGPSKARVFLDGEMAWIQQQRQALQVGAFNSNPTLARATLAELQSREQQARGFEKTALIEQGRGGGHAWFAEAAALKADLTAVIQNAEQREQVITYGGFGVGAVVVLGLAYLALAKKRSNA